MTLRRLFAAALALLLAVFIWLAWPVYGFYAHRGEVPLPFGWIDAPEEPAPLTLKAPDAIYNGASARVMALLRDHRAKIGAPAISAAVGRKGEVIWAGTVGWADLKAQTRATPDTIFRVGSTSKAITATALARLVQKGIIDLDTPISRYWPGLPNPAWAQITPRQLASHMAGLPHYKENTDYAGLYQTLSLSTRFADVRDAVEIFDESELLFPPGTDFHYSTLGTVLLGAVMSEAAGKPYRTIVQEEVLAPATMTATLPAPRAAGTPEALARFYLQRDGRYREWRPVDLSHRLPGGGYASTPSDLVRMGLRQLDDSYLSPEIRKAFWTPQKLSSGETNEQDYAVGWRWREWDVDGVGVARNANHGGVSRGSQAWLIVLPDYEMAIAFTINTNTDEFSDFGQIWDDIFRAFVRVPAE